MSADKDANRLAFNIGMFCGACDDYLGRDYFGPMARDRAADNTLTEAYFDVLRAEAQLLGVPEDLIAAIPKVTPYN